MRGARRRSEREERGGGARRRSKEEERGGRARRRSEEEERGGGARRRGSSEEEEGHDELRVEARAERRRAKPEELRVEARAERRRAKPGELRVEARAERRRGQSPEELRVEARAEEEARAEKMRIGRCGGGERRRTGGAREVVGHANEANRSPKKCPRAKEGQSTNSGRIRGEGEDHRGREETRRREREGTSSRWSGTKSWGA